MVFKDYNVYQGGKFIGCRNVEITNGVISGITQSFNEPKGYLVPGFIDIHSHGAKGRDVMEGTAEALAAIAEWHLSEGVTTWYPTTLTAEIADIVRVIECCRQAMRRGGSKGADIQGVHVEGPFLSPSARGAHRQELLLAPVRENTGFINSNTDVVKRITLAPDLHGAAHACKDFTSYKVQVSLGHDASVDEEIDACVAAGAGSVTHIYNCTSRPSRRAGEARKRLGLTEAGLIDKRLIVEVIADNVHVPDVLFGMIFKLKGARGICLVSDSISVAGMPEGDQRVRVKDGVAVLADSGVVAGSVTSIGGTVLRLATRGIVSLADAVTMAALTPARLMGLKDRGDIKVGMRADINIINKELNYVTNQRR